MIKSVAITGHTPNRLRGQEEDVKNWIRKTLSELNPKEAYCGMARGVDQIFAKICIDDLGIDLSCYYPYYRSKFHPEEEYINTYAKNILFCSDTKKNFPSGEDVYTHRDKCMIDACDILLAVFDGKYETGGTYNAIQYAKSIGKQILYFPWKD